MPTHSKSPVNTHYLPVGWAHGHNNEPLPLCVWEKNIIWVVVRKAEHLGSCLLHSHSVMYAPTSEGQAKEENSKNATC